MEFLSPDDKRVLKSIDDILQDMPYYVDDFRAAKQRHGTSYQTINQYLYRIRIFFAWMVKVGKVSGIDKSIYTKTDNYMNLPFKEITLADIEGLSKRDIERFIDEISQENIAPKSANGTQKQVKLRDSKSIALMISTLKTFFHFLAVLSEDDDRKTYINHNVMVKIQIPMAKETSANRAAAISAEIIDGAQFWDFIKFIDGGSETDRSYVNGLLKPQQKTTFKRDKERDIAMIAILLATGIRVGELARIRLENINFAKQTISITRKGNKKDVVYVMDYAFERLMDYIKVRNFRYPQAEQSPFLFLTYRSPARPITIRAIQAIIEKYTSSYFTNGIYPHKLRHSFSVAFVKNGGDLSILRDLLGHTDIKTTSLYVNMANSDKVHALDALNRYLLK